MISKLIVQRNFNTGFLENTNPENEYNKLNEDKGLNKTLFHHLMKSLQGTNRQTLWQQQEKKLLH